MPSETVLLCEDTAAVRDLIDHILASHGYTVLAASHPSVALELATAYRGPIDVLVSDVIMPELPGPELAERLRARRPGLRTLFVSGQTAEALRDREGLPPDSAFLEKPFAQQDLLRAIRGLLDQAAEHGSAALTIRGGRGPW